MLRGHNSSSWANFRDTRGFVTAGCRLLSEEVFEVGASLRF